MIDVDHEVRENGRRVSEVVLDMRALDLTGKTAEELFQGWSGTAVISIQLPPEVQELARIYLKELKYQASLGKMDEDEDEDVEAQAPLLAPIKTVGGKVLVASSYAKGVIGKARQYSANFGRETIGDCGC